MSGAISASSLLNAYSLNPFKKQFSLNSVKASDQVSQLREQTPQSDAWLASQNIAPRVAETPQDNIIAHTENQTPTNTVSKRKKGVSSTVLGNARDAGTDKLGAY